MMMLNLRVIPDKYGSSGQARGLQAFTLVELAVVLMVIAAVMGGGIAMMSAGLKSAAANDSAAKLRILQRALYDYRLAYNRLPCPASSSVYLATDANFGVEAASAGNCVGSTPAADDGDANVAIGMFPVRTLGLPDEMALDSWGRRIRYAVPPAFVAADAFDTIAATDTTARLTVNNNDNSAALTTMAAFALISYGENGHGARGGATGTLINSAVTNAGELLNCKCGSTGAFDAAVTPATFVQGMEKPSATNPLNNFDDIVVFSTRADLRDANE